MFNRTINVNAKPDWETHYPPELVGQYLNSLWEGFDYDEVIEMKPGMVIMTPQPTLQGFLLWCAQRKGDKNETN